MVISITAPPKDYSVLFLDMNSFFASVEQQVQPTLRGLPVGVAPYVGGSGCIIAASYEAKNQGIKICRVSDAKRICPRIKIVESRPALYLLYHKEIKKVIESFSPYFQPLSIDEFVIRLTPGEQNHKKSYEMALGLKRAINERVGDYLRCSIGIGPSQFLAKLAGERQKPDGLTVVCLSELEKFYQGLKLTDLPGINSRLETFLQIKKIYSPTDLFNLALPDLIRVLKHPGRLWYYRLRGYEVDDFIIKNKTIGHSHVLAPELRSRDGALSVLNKLVHKAGYRLRKDNYLARGAGVSVHFVDRGGFHTGRKFPPFSDDKSFIANTYELLRGCRWQSRPIYVAVAAFDLVRNSGEQISIFKELEKARAISKSLDSLNDRFGADTIYPASMFGGVDAAPDRIPFGQPRYDIRHG